MHSRQLSEIGIFDLSRSPQHIKNAEVNFSGKITNSLICFAQQASGTDLSEVVESQIPAEFLRDPTSWLEAKQVETWLRACEDYLDLHFSSAPSREAVGHAAKSLRAWGVLDSVLCMIEKPGDIFLQPQRFISYFISPAPPIANIKRASNAVAFDLPISFEEFPCTLTYLRSAIEAVPLFMGAQMAECKWRQNSVSISWSTAQPTLDDISLLERKMAPEMMQNLILTLEKAEHALHEKTIELEKIKSENEKAAQSQVGLMPSLLSNQKVQSQEFQQQVLKLQDYFTRSQQLITLLIGQDRKTAQIKEAMKRVKWDQVQESFPKVTRQILDHLHLPLESELENLNEKNNKSARARDSRQPWLPHS